MRVIGRQVHRHSKVLAGPGAKINVFATLATKRPERIAWHVQTVALANRADDNFVYGLIRRHVPPIQEQSVSSNDTSALTACRRSSLSCRINLTETIKRLPLISGIKPKLGSIRSRSN